MAAARSVVIAAPSRFMSTGSNRTDLLLTFVIETRHKPLFTAQ
jgi:hypothetical protein